MILFLLSFLAWAEPISGTEVCDFGSVPKSEWNSHSTSPLNWGPGDGARPRDSTPYYIRLEEGWKAKVKSLAKECPKEEEQILHFLERANESCSLYLRMFQFKDEGPVLGELGLVAFNSLSYKRELAGAEKKKCKALAPYVKQLVDLTESTISLGLSKVSSDQCEELSRKVDASRLKEKCAGSAGSGSSGF